ncbi:bifunctional folylpolyglutamate synthase/dihydrofolate synthase [candidate division WOR-3 bacterium]|nr:bifunctional folylpolyglutamate synthase/dihydrofolate synthase [candidate division WOR-3 bacterium]
MDFPQAEEYLNSLINREKSTRVKYPDSLIRFREYLKEIDSPQEGLNAFHVAGTKGKGSTVHIIEVFCRASGYSTGLYTSPHVSSVRERIRINGELISRELFASLIGELASTGRKVSYFETLTAVAFLLFKREKVDYSIFEVGLGGRLDATNVIDSTVSIITPISFDHTKTLGNTIEEIAGEKAGILKEDGINISAPQLPAVENILKEKTNGNIQFVTDCEVLSVTQEGTSFLFDNNEFHIGLIGEHQALNASVALTACKKMGIPLDFEKINRAFSRFNIPGRFQILKEDPYIVLDGAHNVASMNVLKEAISKVFKKKVLLVFSCRSDKDLSGMLGEIKSVVKRIYPTTISSPISITPEVIKDASVKKGIKISSLEENSIKALQKAISDASTDDVIVVTGSFYLLGDILQSPFLNATLGGRQKRSPRSKVQGQ